ncbi:AraC family transcriptional regulator, partial [Lachnospiraceae bacterium OttesenSCG-928-D06]|nr:AraC family transcriptional regulator [Lachnospiraceae bacterium OttesenSCG-928-D06]
VKEQFPFHELLLKEKLNEIFYLLFTHNCMIENSISHSASLYSEKVKQALLYIQENYREPITISRLAKLCSFSEIHFMNFFKKTVGMPCMEYIIKLRLQVSTNLLTLTSLSISEIALECGFNNLSNYNRQFKSVYLQTPSEYRRMNKEIVSINKPYAN